jgi:hypothetical protein
MIHPGRAYPIDPAPSFFLSNFFFVVVVPAVRTDER